MPTADLMKRARTDLGAYHLCTNPEFRWVRFQQVCLVPALHAAAEHKIHALMILMCFRHGKTELGTLSFQAWLTGRWPKRKNMVLSYSDKFAKRFGRKILEKVRSETHQLIFPDCELSPTARSGSYFVTTQGGEFYTSGFSGTITGQGVDGILSIDDPLKGMEEATSKPMLDDRMEDYRSAAGTRLEGGSKVLICNRWCRGDFVDRVLDEEGEVKDGGQWTVIRIPAQAEENDPLGRRVGDYLWPERLGDEWYERHKAKPRLWNSMCQQNPSKNYGKFFKKEWILFYPKMVRPGRFPAYMLTDPAKSKGKENDRTCILIFVATPEKRLLIVDASIGRYDPGQRGAECIRLLRKWRPKRWLYEEYGMVSDTWYLEQEAKKAGIHTKPIGVGLRGPRHSLSKETRIEGLIPDFREGRIWLPDIWGDVTEGRPAVPFPTMSIEGVGDYGEKRDVNIVEYMLEELLNYSGEGSTTHDDFLDCLERIHEEECGIIFPTSSIVEQGRSMEYQQNRRQSWESLL